VNIIDQAALVLSRGELVVVPTDTVYGVAAGLDDSRGIAALFAAKGRRSDKPLPVLGDRIPALETVVDFDPQARAIAERFWPGPLTLVLPRAEGFDVDLGGGPHNSVAVRIPQHVMILELIGQAGPLAVSSANRSDRPAALTLEQARAELGETVAVFLDGGTLRGRPSTIVSMIGEPALIREGDVPFSEVQRVMS
jgi:L-threonylcarbamoyladenylate synthase